MKYLLLCQVQPANFANMPKEAAANMMEEMMSYNHQLIQAGVLLAAGHWLHLTRHSVCLHLTGAFKPKKVLP